MSADADGGAGTAPVPGEDEHATAVTRYPGYDVLARWRGPDWDAPTRDVVRRRIEDIPPIRFFTGAEAALLDAIAARIVPQDDRAPADRVPIVAWIDEKLHHDRRDGYRYEELPPLRDVWRSGLAGVEESARLLHGKPFVQLPPPARDDVLRRIQRGDAPGETWTRLGAIRFFRDVLCLTVVKTYYGDPVAWSEIGYSGPSSPRGHVRNWMGGVDPWEAQEEGR